MPGIARMACNQFVERVTDFLEGALTPAEQKNFEAHFASCEGCQTYLEQMSLTVCALARGAEELVSPETRAKLLDLFRQTSGTVSAQVRKTFPLGIGDQFVSAGDHIAYFWESPEQFELGINFLETGLRAGDCGFVFGYEEANRRVVESLRRRGFDIESLRERRRLMTAGGVASGEQMLSNLGALFLSALAAGAPAIRLLGNLGWGRPEWPNDEGILEFEARVTEAARQFPCVILCMYEVRALSGRLILKGGFQTHPLTVCDQTLHQNNHYVPLETFVAGLRRETGEKKVQ